MLGVHGLSNILTFSIAILDQHAQRRLARVPTCEWRWRKMRGASVIACSASISGRSRVVIFCRGYYRRGMRRLQTRHIAVADQE